MLIEGAPGRLKVGRPVAIIDIGSNSVRLVAYEGLTRAPIPLYNEKVMCGLGRNVATTGRLDEEAIDDATVRIREGAEVHTEPNQGQEIHRLARAEHVAVLQDAVGAADFVEQLAGIGFEELLARVELVLHDRLQHRAEALDDILLGLAEGRLV